MSGPISYASVASSAVKTDKDIKSDSKPTSASIHQESENEKLKPDSTEMSTTSTTTSLTTSPPSTTTTPAASTPFTDNIAVSPVAAPASITTTSSVNSTTNTSPIEAKPSKLLPESQNISKKSAKENTSPAPSSKSSATSTTATTPVDKKAGLTPAPVPVINVWQKRSSVGNATEDFKGEKSLDSLNWPKPDESTVIDHTNLKKENGSSTSIAATSVIPPSKPRSGKEKWIPYTPSPGPINNSGATSNGANSSNKRGNQKIRANQNGKTNGHAVGGMSVEKRNSGNNSSNTGKKKVNSQATSNQHVQHGHHGHQPENSQQLQQQQHQQHQHQQQQHHHQHQQLQQQQQISSHKQSQQNELPSQAGGTSVSANSTSNTTALSELSSQATPNSTTVTKQLSDSDSVHNESTSQLPNGEDSSLKKTSPTPKHEKSLSFKDKPRFRHEDANGFHNNHHRNMYRRPQHFNKNIYMQQQEYMYGQPFLPIGPIPANQYEVTLGLIVTQIEYYMSVENLCKDMYLRRQMNSKGFIPLSILAGFNRVRILTGGDMNLLIDACNWAPSVDLVNSKIRPRNGWENWVLPQKERDSAGLEEDVTVNDDESPKLVFDAAAAAPFIPKEARATRS